MAHRFYGIKHKYIVQLQKRYIRGLVELKTKSKSREKLGLARLHPPNPYPFSWFLETCRPTVKKPYPILSFSRILFTLTKPLST